MNKSKYVAAIMMAGLATGAWAHGTYISVSFPSPIPSIHPLGNLYFPSSRPIEQPKLWNDMSPRERADIWPHLSLRMQRHYWTCMSRADRRAMYKLLMPRAKMALRNRFVFQDPIKHGEPIPAHLMAEFPPQHPPHLTPEQRKRLRSQIRELHDHHRPIRDRIPR